MQLAGIKAEVGYSRATLGPSERRAYELMEIADSVPVDYMLDHEETSRPVPRASFAIAIPMYETRKSPPAKVSSATPALYYAESQGGIDSLGRRIYPQFYVNIGKQLPIKREMLARRTSQLEWLHSHHGIDEYLDQMTACAASYGREGGCIHAEGFRQHVGHGYPRVPVLQKALASYVTCGNPAGNLEPTSMLSPASRKPRCPTWGQRGGPRTYGNRP